jgi:arsenate reductase (glutaredoxin)
MNVTNYHNPACGTSRNTLALIRHAGIEPTVIEYLRRPPSRVELSTMIDDAGLAAILRRRRAASAVRKSLPGHVTSTMGAN